ncbi:MAG: hypothetical protein ISS57_18675 [Anaerolineales bacterium]|nr:hypothetical protein [Anaerolineales bacterium]
MLGHVPEIIEKAEIDFTFGEKQLDIALMSGDEVMAAIAIDIGQTMNEYKCCNYSGIKPV